MSLMKTGTIHNDPYCFRRIEERLFQEELRNPWNRLRLQVRRRLAALESRGEKRRLRNSFLGSR